MQIEKMQTQIAFQEETIEQLNQALIGQQKDITRLTMLVENLNAKLEDVQQGKPNEMIDERPPHY
ncbi:MAG: SlyX family protein [Gammaproteobacteria bacterium]|nr:SlyX family protein [Gammaproteobacteria bacterium]